MNQRGNGWFQSIVRLKPGVSQAQAQAEATSIMAQLEQEYKDFNDGRRLRIVQTWEAPFGAATVLAPILAVLSIAGRARARDRVRERREPAAVESGVAPPRSRGAPVARRQPHAA